MIHQHRLCNAHYCYTNNKDGRSRQTRHANPIIQTDHELESTTLGGHFGELIIEQPTCRFFWYHTRSSPPCDRISSCLSMQASWMIKVKLYQIGFIKSNLVQVSWQGPLLIPAYHFKFSVHHIMHEVNSIKKQFLILQARSMKHYTSSHIGHTKSQIMLFSQWITIRSQKLQTLYIEHTLMVGHITIQ